MLLPACFVCDAACDGVQEMIINLIEGFMLSYQSENLQMWLRLCKTSKYLIIFYGGCINLYFVKFTFNLPNYEFFIEIKNLCKLKKILNIFKTFILLLYKKI